MARHTKKEFAVLCGVELKDLYIYIKRGNVVCEGEYVNDTNEKNVLFLEKRKSKGKDGKIGKEKPLKVLPVVEDGGIIEAIIKASSPEKVESKRSELSLVQLEKEKKLADLSKVEADTVYRQLQIDKLTGISIPTELVKSVISSLSKSFVASFKDGADGFLIEVSKRKNISNSERSQLTGELIKIVNHSIKKAVTQSRRDMKMITDNYSETRDVGQHD